MTKAFDLLNQSSQESGVSTGEQFIKDGLDFRGQAQYAYTNNQKGGGFDIQIDPLKVIGLSSAFSVKGAVTVGKELFVIAAIGPSKAVKVGSQSAKSVTWTIDRPIMLASLQGGVWEGQACASFEVGVSYSAHAGISGSKFLPETGNEILDKAASAELASIAFEASATFKADVGYTYSNAALEDMKPRYFGVNISGADKAALKEEVTELFAAGSSKDAIKNAVVALMNSYKDIYGEQSKTKWIGTNRDMADLTKTLLDGLAKAPNNEVGKTLKARVDNWLGKATPYKATTASQRGLCVLSMSAHRPEASAGVSATIEAKASANMLGSGGISMNFKGPSISGVSKWSSSRFQTYWPVSDAEYLMFTQDQKIRYGQVDVTAFSAQANVELNVAGGSKEKPTLQRGGSVQEDKVKPSSSQQTKPAEESKKTFSAEVSADKKWVYSSLSYTSVCLYWMRSSDDAKVSDGTVVEPLQGSGISIGRSTTLGTLQRLLKAYWDPSDKQLEGDVAGCKLYLFLAEALHVPVSVLSEMIWSPEVKGLIADFESQNDAVEKLIREAKPAMKPERAERLRKNFGGGELPLLIEATFRLPTVELKLQKPKKDTPAKIDEKLFDKAVAAFNKLPVADVPKYLESLRIRLRMRDLRETEDAKRLGFSVFGQSLGISYKSLDKAGAEGTVDLATYWIASELKAGGVAAYEAGVPKAILFDQ